MEAYLAGFFAFFAAIFFATCGLWGIAARRPIKILVFSRLEVFAMPSSKELNQIYQLTGKLISGWGTIELYWYLIFTHVLGGTKREAIDAIYNYLEASAAKRGLILSVADAVYPPHSKTNRPNKIRKRIGTLAAKTNDLSGFRNAIAHAELTVRGETIESGFTIAPGINSTKPNKFAGKNVILELEGVMKDAEKLSRDLEDFLDSMIPLQERFLPKELIEALHKQGFQVPSWAIPYPSPSPKSGDPKP